MSEPAPVVEAVVVNHNSSLFTELAVRSLVASHPVSADVRLNVTVRDNHSEDEDFAGLVSAASRLGVPVEPTRWPWWSNTMNSHGAVLRDFVLGKPEADYYLFVDCDIDFDEPDVVRRMLDDLKADPDRWAVHARFRTFEKVRPGASLDWVSKERLWFRTTFRAEGRDWLLVANGRFAPRCSVSCTLIENSPQFRRVAELIGFSCAVILDQDPALAAYHDTMGVASMAMAASGRHYALSRATVHQFHRVSYDRVAAEKHRDDCRRRLARFTELEGRPHDPSPEISSRDDVLLDSLADLRTAFHELHRALRRLETPGIGAGTSEGEAGAGPPDFGPNAVAVARWLSTMSGRLPRTASLARRGVRLTRTASRRQHSA